MSNFQVFLTGEISSAQLLSEDVFIKYSFTHGLDWTVISGAKSGITQKSTSQKSIFSFNFPLEISFSSTNISGWPQLVICLFGSDFMGREVCFGYGVCRIPMEQ
jgi:B9 domain-containing protein 1